MNIGSDESERSGGRRRTLALLAAALLAACAAPAPQPPETPSARAASPPAQGPVNPWLRGTPPRAPQPELHEPEPLEETVDAPEPAGRGPNARVLFRFASDQVDEAAGAEIARIAREAMAHPQSRIVLQAHTDDRGSREFNLALAQRRAERVEAVLAELGFPERRIVVQSFGEELASGSARQRRRVDIWIERDIRAP